MLQMALVATSNFTESNIQIYLHFQENKKNSVFQNYSKI